MGIHHQVRSFCFNNGTDLAGFVVESTGEKVANQVVPEKRAIQRTGHGTVQQISVFYRFAGETRQRFLIETETHRTK